MTPEERAAPGDEPNTQLTRSSGPSETHVLGTTEAESLRHQIRQTRSEMGDTIDDIERQLDGERLKARAEELADHLMQEAAERAKQVVLEATDHAKDAAKEITDHALTETKLAIREMTGQASSAARGATIGKVEDMVQNASQSASGVGSSVVEMITRNPMAAAIAGIGLGWLLLGNRSSSAGNTQRYYPRTGQYTGGRSQLTGESGQPLGEHISHLGEKVGDKFGEAQTAARGAIDQVQETAGSVAGQAQEVAQGAGSTVGDVGSTLLETIQEHPLPTLLAAGSLGYLFLNRPGTRAPAPVYQARYRAEQAAGQLRESTGQLADEVQGTAGEMAGRIQQTTGRMATQAQETLGEIGDSVQTQALRSQYRFEQFFSDRPLVVGAAALTLGLLAGLPVPQTQQEHQLMGEASGKVIDRAQSAVQETAQKLQQAAEQQGPDEDLRNRANAVADEAEQLAQKLNRPA